MLGKMEAGREFQFLEVMETNVLEGVGHFSNLTAKVLGISEMRATRKACFGGNY